MINEYRIWDAVGASGDPSNTVSTMTPELWAMAALRTLREQLVMANMVHVDYSDEIAEYGDTVNCHSLGSFSMQRKAVADDVNPEAATATNVPVVLNQHIYASFLLKDSELSTSIHALIPKYLEPAMFAVARGLDQVIATNVYSFMGNSVGRLGTAVSRSTITALRELLNKNKVPMDKRNCIVTAGQETDYLNVEEFTNANTIGDDGSAMREGHLGRKFGINHFMSLNVPSIAAGNTTVTGAINKTAGYSAGDLTIAVDGFSAAITAGSWFTVAGDDTPQQVASTVGGSTPTSITFTPGLKRAVVNNAVVTVYSPGAINLSAGYEAATISEMAVDGFTVSPKDGQLLSFDDDGTGARYGIIDSINGPSTTAVMTNIPTAAAVVNDQVAGIGPAGEFGFCFHPEALALVVRPLATIPPETGALSFVASYEGLSVRVTMQYQGYKQGMLVTVDMLCGTKVLNTNLGAVVYG
jgi:hypothetical protein